MALKDEAKQTIFSVFAFLFSQGEKCNANQKKNMCGGEDAVSERVCQN